MIEEQNTAEEDLTGLAGWMYTDLLLALMVVFLATISFVPALETTSNLNSKNESNNFKYPKFLDLKYNRKFKLNDVNNFLIELNSFKTSNNLDDDIVIGSIQIIGGYNSSLEKSTEGIQRALRFVSSIQEQNNSILKNASTILDTSKNQNVDSVQIVVSFIPKSKLK